MAWRLAESLAQLRAQLDAQFPRRDRTSDGSIGDAAHASRSSDHNAWVKDGRMGVVTALDVDRDIAPNYSAADLAEELRKSRDPRIKYIISMARIASSYPAGGKAAWEWRTYTGSNAHKEHMHLSVNSDKRLYDSETPWPVGKTTKQIEVVTPPVTTPTVPIPEAEIETRRAILKLGSAGEDVGYLQRMLGKLEDDNDFGPLTEARVKEFQKMYGLPQSGVVDAASWAAIED